MGSSLSRKIIESHLVEGSWKPGEEIGIKIDQTLTQDATGTMAYLEFETLNIERARTELSVSYIDHNTLQIGFENADDHAYLTSIAQKYGILLSRAGNGICHQVHLERFGVPGKTLLGSDSHTPTSGGLSMLAIGAGGLDVALAMAGEPFFFVCPHVVRIFLKGSLGKWVSAKDIALKVLEIFGTKGNVGTIFEYTGPGIITLSVPERATIANMGAECGVTTTIFPSDDQTKAFLDLQGRLEAYIPLSADYDAAYDDSIEIDLDELEPLAAVPHSPGNVKPVREIEGIKVDQVCIGSCTNSSYRDLAIAAQILKGKTIAPDLSLVVAPGSRQVLRSIARDGYLDMLLAAGARLVEPSCSFCIGNGHSPASGAVSLRTSNRNFEGRSGTKDAQVYLVSPETAAYAALLGTIRDPRTLEIDPTSISAHARPLIDDNLILKPLPASLAAAISIRRGPNIGVPPTLHPLSERIDGLVAIKVGDKITTDHIMPAGDRMKYRSNIPAYAHYVFEPIDPNFAVRAQAARDNGDDLIIVAGSSYGQGSSREHAAICPAFLGVRAVLAKSFERIHTANLINFGILPLLFDDETDYDKIQIGDRFQIENLRWIIGNEQLPLNFIVKDISQGIEIPVHSMLTPRQRKMLLAGGALGLVSSGQFSIHSASTPNLGAQA
ncbi:MAG TPA: aconitate hydratase [Rectinema sp.]|nr:aconitate hydratase [Rectinema sp.]HQG15610.1 aconitate hydratase [Rectinema sp.]